MSIINPMPLPPFGGQPYNNITPFTYRDGLVYVEKLADLQKFVRALVDSTNGNFKHLEEYVNNAITVNQQWTLDSVEALTTYVNEQVQVAIDDGVVTRQYVDTQIQLIINSSVQVQDPVVSALLLDPASDTRITADGIYPLKPVNGERPVGKNELIVNVLDFGAVGDSNGATGGTDDTTAINEAITEAITLNATLWFPKRAFGYRTDYVIDIPGTIDVVMDSPIYSNHQGIGINYNPAPNPISSRRTLKLQQVRATQSNWSDESVTGIVTRNVMESDIRIVRVSGNTIGYLRLGDNAGHVHNTTRLGILSNNKYGLDCDATGGGWVNEELILAGRFTVNTGINRDQSRYGIRVRSSNNYYHNAVTYMKPSIELNAVNMTAGEALPILVMHGMYNNFIDVRDEGNGDAVIRTENNSQENTVSVSFGGQLKSKIEDVGLYPSTTVKRAVVSSRESAVSRVFETGALHKLITPYNSGEHMIPGCVLMGSGSGQFLRQASSITPQTNSISYASRAVGKVIDVSSIHRFVIRRQVAGGGGRVIVKPFDENMQLIDGSVTKLVRSTAATAVFWSTQYGGVYTTGADAVGPVFVDIDPSVRYVYVAVSGGTNPANIIGMSVDSLDPGIATVVDIFPEAQVPLATQTPASGTYNRGMRVKHGSPAVGQPTGWVCTESGSPGTWVAEKVL